MRKNKIIGIIPARMEASRFPGKPLYPICGKPMVEHVFLRAQMFTKWDILSIATCNVEIKDFAIKKDFPVIMTGNHHIRALDRVAEAAQLLVNDLQDNDIIICVQGDEPMLKPDMIDTVIEPLFKNENTPGAILAMHIDEEEIWLNPDTVKIIFNSYNEVLYTSRAPIPYIKGKFSPDLMARRIYGIFSFRWKFLKEFTEHNETRLESIESCDSNRILDMSFRQSIAPYRAIKSFSVDSPSDITLVEKYMNDDEFWHQYKNK